MLVYSTELDLHIHWRSWAMAFVHDLQSKWFHPINKLIRLGRLAIVVISN